MINEAKAQEAVKTLLRYIGEDPSREGLADTPTRFLKAWKNDFFVGYEQDPNTVLKTVFREHPHTQPITMRDIKFYSYCEHHIVPIIGKVHITYLPGDGIIGISKLVRLVEIYARRLQVQERLTNQICDALQQGLNPRGVAVMVEAEHLCMSSRGVKTAVELTTTAFSGLYQTDPHAGLIALQRGTV